MHILFSVSHIWDKVFTGTYCRRMNVYRCLPDKQANSDYIIQCMLRDVTFTVNRPSKHLRVTSSYHNETLLKVKVDIRLISCILKRVCFRFMLHCEPLLYLWKPLYDRRLYKKYVCVKFSFLEMMRKARCSPLALHPWFTTCYIGLYDL